MKAATFTKTGNKASTETTLDKSIFGQKPNPQLLQIAYGRYLNNLRQNNAQTLTRGLVRGGGKKPWRQKGTGRARSGSIRNPIWRGGGIIFGPTGQENYKTNLSKQQLRSALAQSLSAQADRVSVIESFKIAEPKTKLALDLIAKVSDSGNILVVVDKIDPATELACRNLNGVDLTPFTQLTVFAVLNADTILIEKPALENLSSWLTSPRRSEVT